MENQQSTSSIAKKIRNRRDRIEKLKNQIVDLERSFMMTSNRNQTYVEQVEDVLTSGRPKVYEKKLVGRLNWKQRFKDEDTGQVIVIDRSTVVKVDGEFKI